MPELFILLCAAAGVLIGAFLNHLIHRLPQLMEQGWQRECDDYLGKPPSDRPAISFFSPVTCCAACGARVGGAHSVPLIGNLLRRGACPACHVTVSRREPVVTVITGLMFGLVAWRFGMTAQMVGFLGLTAVLVALTFIDADTMLLPDVLTLPLIWAGLLFNIITHAVPLQDAVLGAVAGYTSLWLMFWGFKLATGKEGMGYGDFKLLAAIGAWLGWAALPTVILLSSVVGVLAGLVLMVLARIGRGQAYPFGPYLAAAGWLAMLAGNRASEWLFSLYS